MLMVICTVMFSVHICARVGIGYVSNEVNFGMSFCLLLLQLSLVTADSFVSIRCFIFSGTVQNTFYLAVAVHYESMTEEAWLFLFNLMV